MYLLLQPLHTSYSLNEMSYPLQPIPFPPHSTSFPAPLPKVENLTISNVTPYGFRASWEVRQQPPPQQEELSPSGGGFSHFHIVVTDSGWLLEPQEFTVPGDQSHLDIWGLITGIGYEVKLTGVSESGLLSRPLTTVAVTGIAYSALRGPSSYLTLLGFFVLFQLPYKLISQDPIRKFHYRNMMYSSWSWLKSLDRRINSKCSHLVLVDYSQVVGTALKAVRRKRS